MNLVKPKAVPRGGLIGVVAPSGPVDPAGLESGIQALRRAGFRTRLGRHVMDLRGYLAGDDASRAGDLNEMFRDPEVDAVICARGGYGAMRILHAVDYEAIRDSRKVFVGFSDITALHLAIQRQAGLVTFHGPTVEARDPGRLNDYTLEHLFRAIATPEPLGRLSNPAAGPPLRRPRWSTPGRASGRLTGGNLAVIAALVGTPWEIQTRGKILMLEDVAERPYRIDRMLRQLELAGRLSSIAGVILGEFTGCEAEPGKPSLDLNEVFADYFAGRGVPVAAGLCCGHGMHRLTIPLGVRVEIDTTGDEPAVRVVERACV